MLLQHVLLQHHCGSSQGCQHSPSQWRNGARTSAAQKQSFVLLFLFVVIFYNVPIWSSTKPQSPKTPDCCCPSLCVLLSSEAATAGVDGALFAGQGKKKETKKKQMLFFLLLDFSSRKPQTKLEKINKSRTSWEALSALCVSSASFPSLPPFLSSLNLKSLK